MTFEELQQAISDQKDLMVAVATGGPPIRDRNTEYQRRRREIRAELRERGLEDPNPHRDLWAWYGRWSTELGTYAARRQYVSDLYGPLLDALDDLEERTLGTDLQLPETGWGRVDHQLAQLRERYATAESVEDFQAVGLVCRDLLRSLADATFEDAFVPEGRETPGPADAVARLEYVIDAYAPGAANREVRKTVKSHLDLANAVQHDRDATLLDATIIAEASMTTANLIRALVVGPGEVAEDEDSEDDPRDWRELDDP